MLFLNDRKRDEKSYELLERHCELEKSMLDLFDEENIDILNLKEKLASTRKLYKETLKFLGKFENKKEKGKQEERDVEYTFVKEKELDKNLLDGYEKAKDEIKSVYEYIDKNKENVVVLNLDLFKKFVCDFSLHLLKKEEPIKNGDIEGVTCVLSGKEDKTSLMLKSGKKVIITHKNYNFTDFSYEELLEILRFFDIVVSDNSYDHIRTEITKQINAISSVSSIS